MNRVEKIIKSIKKRYKVFQLYSEYYSETNGSLVIIWQSGKRDKQGFTIWRRWGNHFHSFQIPRKEATEIINYFKG